MKNEEEIRTRIAELRVGKHTSSMHMSERCVLCNELRILLWVLE